MGTVTLDKLDRLMWLGRYSERAYTTVKAYFDGFDRMIDQDEDYYKEFCEKIGIPDVYGSKKNFIDHYPFDEEDPNSIASNLNRAFDNAIIMREIIGSETFSYLQLAVYDIRSSTEKTSHLFNLISLQDHLLAFWGSLDDEINDESIRRIVKSGKWIERLDLMLRMGQPQQQLLLAFERLKVQLASSGIRYNEAVCNTLQGTLESSRINYRIALELLGRLIERE